MLCVLKECSDELFLHINKSEMAFFASNGPAQLTECFVMISKCQGDFFNKLQKKIDVFSAKCQDTNGKVAPAYGIAKEIVNVLQENTVSHTQKETPPLKQKGTPTLRVNTKQLLLYKIVKIHPQKKPHILPVSPLQKRIFSLKSSQSRSCEKQGKCRRDRESNTRNTAFGQLQQIIRLVKLLLLQNVCC